jgi:hypothetical protein
VRPAHRDTELSQPRGEEWLLIEWPDGEAEPTKYWFATVPEDIALDRLVDVAKLRWRIAIPEHYRPRGAADPTRAAHANSIATVGRRLIVALARTLPRCPCCNTPIRKIAKIPDY